MAVTKKVFFGKLSERLGKSPVYGVRSKKKNEYLTKHYFPVRVQSDRKTKQIILNPIRSFPTSLGTYTKR